MSGNETNRSGQAVQKSMYGNPCKDSLTDVLGTRLGGSSGHRSRYSASIAYSIT